MPPSAVKVTSFASNIDISEELQSDVSDEGGIARSKSFRLSDMISKTQVVTDADQRENLTDESDAEIIEEEEPKRKTVRRSESCHMKNKMI